MKKSFVSIGLCVLTFACFAQSNNNPNKLSLTVNDAVEIALANNLTVKQEEMNLALLEKKDKYSWNSVSPSLSLSGGVNGSKAGTVKDGPASFSKADNSTSWSTSGSISFSFTPALGTSIKEAKLAYEAGQMSYEKTKKSIELSVRKTFYSLLYFNENLKLKQRNLETAKQTYESNLSKYNQGRLSEINLLNSQYNYESKIPEVTNLQTDHENEMDNFKIVLGLDLNDEIELAGSLEEIASKKLNMQLLDIDIEEIPTIKESKKNIEKAENSLAATKLSAYGPTLSLSGSLGGSGGISPETDSRLSLSYSASVRIPLDSYLPWSKNALSVDSQKDTLEKQKQTLEQTKKTTEISIKNQYNTIKKAKAQLELYEKNVELTQNAYNMTLASYNVGSSDLLTLHTAEDNLYKAKADMEKQHYTIISAVLDLENLLGLDFGALTR